LLTVIELVAEFFVVIALALAAILLNAIDGRGFLASAVVGFAIIYGGGLTWFIVVAVFFTLGVAFTLYKYGYKKMIGAAQGKGGARNWPNILANGGVASAVAISNFFGASSQLAVLFLGAVSASAADTVATELGLLSTSEPRLITDLSTRVSPGTSGGVSILGFVGAAFASLVIGAMGLALGIIPQPLIVLPLCLVGGLAGTVVHSIIGAKVQRRGYCSICLKQTEALSHCGERTRVTGGIRFIENNVVNLLATITGAGTAVGLFTALSP
jgi:uncharacterized protein (TIGR00297 family)